MRIYPAIDLIDGKAVRLERGDYAKKTEYSTEPAEVAKDFAAEGAEYIHVVDLDGAKAKKAVNLEAVRAICESVDIPIQVGGGIRSAESAKVLLDYADRIIIGTVAITEPETLKGMLDKFGPERVVVSVDYKAGKPAVNGWLEEVELTTEALQARLSGLGIRVVIVTDTALDGLMGGPNVLLMKQWSEAGFEVICAGGVASRQDVKELKDAGIDGAIIGKALYEGKIGLKEAIDAGK
ncbi:MAG TPA: 1-(5-phosphoribosyl)-5-[(5-phosphoribosylamino)methylideneamino]imidazole-4-carboxamide isomerase [Candidatus Saccharimonadales bacterium]|nr:1-(5-phosphoribosyl)-5-[(5-phosphoribosylamino)methylideneamino]imidazole-4-carboxamide isomerase [Candidatus Saccharimonadales bacterium]